MFPSREDPYFMCTFPSAPRPLHSRLPGIPSMGWEVANICSKIRMTLAVSARAPCF